MWEYMYYFSASSFQYGYLPPPTTTSDYDYYESYFSGRLHFTYHILLLLLFTFQAQFPFWQLTTGTSQVRISGWDGVKLCLSNFACEFWHLTITRWSILRMSIIILISELEVEVQCWDEHTLFKIQERQTDKDLHS